MSILKVKTLDVQDKIVQDGILITVRSKEFKISYPASIWKKTPNDIKNNLLDNLISRYVNYAN